MTLPVRTGSARVLHKDCVRMRQARRRSPIETAAPNSASAASIRCVCVGSVSRSAGGDVVDRLPSPVLITDERMLTGV